jgi:hypothetical protein
VGAGVNSITDLVCLLLQALKLSEALISEAAANNNDQKPCEYNKERKQ